MIFRKLVFAAVLAGGLAATVPGVCAQTLWEEDVYIGLPAHDFPGSGDSLVDSFTLYDSEGQQAGETIATAEVGQFFGTMKKGSLWSYQLNGETFIQNTSTLEILAHVLPEEGACWTGRAHFCIYEIGTGAIEVYDRDGTLLERNTPTVLADREAEATATSAGQEAEATVTSAGQEAEATVTSEDPEAEATVTSEAETMAPVEAAFAGPAAEASEMAPQETEMHPQIIMTGVESEDALVMRILSRSWEGTECIYGFRYGADGSWTDSTDAAYPEVLMHGCEYTLGRFLLYGNENTVLYDVYSSEGVCLMEGVSIVYALENGYNPVQIDRPRQGENARVSFITRENEGQRTVYDRNLQQIGRTDRMQVQSWGTVVVGLPCDALGGRVCENVYPYCEQERIPAAFENDTWFVYVNGELISFALPGEESLVSLNDRYVQTGLKDEAGNINGYRLYLLEDLIAGKAEVKLDHIPEQMALCAGSCLRSEGPYDERRNILYNAELQPVLETAGFMRPAVGGNYYLRRGPWHGIVDSSGSWLIREGSMAE